MPLCFEVGHDVTANEDYGFPDHEIIARKIVSDLLVARLNQRKAAAERELKKLEEDRRDVLQNYNPDFMKKVRKYETERQKTKVVALRDIPPDTEMTSAALTKQMKMHSQKDTTDDTANKFLIQGNVQYDVSKDSSGAVRCLLTHITTDDARCVPR